ncbi:antitoxin [Janibacter sp. DB-40]|uniref:antitoxin n=1 Tax=Janibacter sp. DB-40 TaxID=3028808 RepID=UPI0024075778|nr:antitoxin [Janibacter sp. DB-40]
MPKFKRAAVVLTAVESARKWAHQNPDKATGYIDKATGFIDKRTHGKYHRQIGGISSQAKKALTGRQGVSGPTVPGETTSRTDRPYPDMRA